MSRILYKRIIPQYFKLSEKKIIFQRFLSSCVNHSKSNASLLKSIYPSVCSSQWRIISSSNVLHSSGKSYKQIDNHIEPSPDISNDEEFQNILKDFAEDFNFNVESEGPILEEIKQTLNQPELESIPPSNKKDTKSSSEPAGEKYKNFSELDSVVIPSQEDVESGIFTEEEITFHVDQKWNRDTLPDDHKRGISGVFEIEELVPLLKKENLSDIAVISIPKELHYADFLVLVTAMSPRHAEAAAEYIIKTYKKKKHVKDPFIVAEGEKTANWKCLDMGNIVVHILSEETRAFYDIESLWLFDQDFDTGGTLKSDPIYDALQEQMAFFNSLESSNSTQTQKKFFNV